MSRFRLRRHYLATLAAQQPVVNYITISPATSNTEGIHNPLRGPYQWQDATEDQGVDTGSNVKWMTFRKYYWISMEASEGVYDFSSIETNVAAADAMGAKHVIHLRPMLDDVGETVHRMPQFYPHFHRPDGTPIPDWNDPDYITAWQNLWEALGEEYADDPRVLGVDASCYGTFGEWSMKDEVYSETNPSRPPGTTDATYATLCLLLDAVIDNFPNKFCWVPVKNQDHTDAVVYGLGRGDKVSWTVRNLSGNSDEVDYFDFDTNPHYVDTTYPAMVAKFGVAPVQVEPGGSGAPWRAHEQVMKWHIDTIADGNLTSWAAMSPEDKAYWQEAMALAGYRYRVNAITVPDPFVAGTNINITTEWENIGSNPIFEPVTVKYKLVDAGDATLVTWTSTIDLHLVDNGTHTHTDTFAIPANIADVAYDLRVVLEHEQTNLQIANTGRESDGSYTLTSVDGYSGGAGLININFESNPATPFGFSVLTDTLGYLSVAASAALKGSSYGLKATIPGGVTANGYGSKTISEPYSTTGKLRFRFYFDPNSLTMAVGSSTNHYICQAFNSADGSICHIVFGNNGSGQYQLRLGRTIAGSNPVSTWKNITDAPHYIEVYATRSSADGVADGGITWWIDGVEQDVFATDDNYTEFPDFRKITMGIVNALDATTSGDCYFDELVVNDTGVAIGA